MRAPSKSRDDRSVIAPVEEPDVDAAVNYREQPPRRPVTRKCDALTCGGEAARRPSLAKIRWVSSSRPLGINHDVRCRMLGGPRPRGSHLPPRASSGGASSRHLR